MSPNSYLAEDKLPNLGLTLLSQEPSANKAIVCVFLMMTNSASFAVGWRPNSDVSDFDYAYLDAIEDLVPLEPQDRLGRLLELEPVQADELAGPGPGVVAYRR